MDINTYKNRCCCKTSYNPKCAKTNLNVQKNDYIILQLKIAIKKAIYFIISVYVSFTVPEGGGGVGRVSPNIKTPSETCSH